jgi:hypothetical protein
MPPSRDLLVELTVNAHWAPARPARRLGISVNGVFQGMEVLQGETALGIRVPHELATARQSLDIGLDHPDAASPYELGEGKETRRISVALIRASVVEVPITPTFLRVARPPAPLTGDGGATDAEVVRGLTGLSSALLVQSFEGLGLNCEFGLFQREFGVETLGLLRFVGLPYVQLLRAIRESFSELDQLESVETVLLDDGQVYFRTETYSMTYQAFLKPDDTRLINVAAQQPRQLRFRRDKLLSLLETGEKLFVVLRPTGLSLAQALPLATAISEHGPGALLFITTDTRLPAGSVLAHGPRLYEGYVSAARLDPTNEWNGGKTWLTRRAVIEWLSVTSNAYRLWRQHGFD